jgi:hypothetical protein
VAELVDAPSDRRSTPFGNNNFATDRLDERSLILDVGLDCVELRREVRSAKRCDFSVVMSCAKSGSNINTCCKLSIFSN